jgi:hypothetical protein
MQKSLLSLALVCLLGAASAQAGQEPFAVCAGRTVDPETALWIEELTERLRPGAALDVKPVIIPVAFHVIASGREGQVSKKNIRTLMKHLNRAFRGTPFSFVLARLDFTNKPAWYNDCGPGSANEAAMKRHLARDPATTLNIYSCKPYIRPGGFYVLGYSSFPFEFPEGSSMHGVLLHPAAVPGGWDPRYNNFGLTPHEVGHYLGLMHTFQNGCQGNGDHVADTPAQAQPHNGCPADLDTCADAEGPDDVHNFMNYSDDRCSQHFTPGQVERAIQMTGTYRPKLVRW